MAKSVDLIPKKKAEELLAKATGKGLHQVPPPAKPQPGVTGNPPLPVGKVVGIRSPSSLTPAERSALEAIGWTEDVPIPSNMAEIFKEISKEAIASSENLTSPVDPRLQKVAPKTVELEQMSPEDKARWVQTMKQKAEEQKLKAEAEAAESKTAAISMSVPGLADAMRATNLPSTEPMIVDDRGGVPLEEAKKQETKPISDTGASARLTHCPHCLWDLGMPGIPEPPYEDKLSFIHSILGQRCWVREYSLMGDQVRVAFRTLTPREIEVVYKQAYKDRNKGKLPEEMDFWEQVNRYRMFMQLQTVKALGPNGFIKELPDALSKETNPEGTGFWWTVEKDEYLQDGDTPLPTIEEHLMENVLKTEPLFRIINTTCNQFNRLVAKLEAMVDNSDFWKPTGGQS